MVMKSFGSSPIRMIDEAINQGAFVIHLPIKPPSPVICQILTFPISFTALTPATIILKDKKCMCLLKIGTCLHDMQCICLCTKMLPAVVTFLIVLLDKSFIAAENTN